LTQQPRSTGVRHRSRVIEADPMSAGFNIVRGSDTSHYVALDAHAQIRALPILGLDRSPLPRNRSHQFDSLLRQLTYLLSSDGGCRLAECFATVHHRPSDSGHLVGHSDRDDACRTPLAARNDPSGKLGFVAAISLAMRIPLDHTVVPSRERDQSARFFASIFGRDTMAPARTSPRSASMKALSWIFDTVVSFETHHDAFHVSDRGSRRNLAEDKRSGHHVWPQLPQP